jgi:signal transduction histidine kinase
MFHSIRWRLVASYVLLTLLTTSLVGILALSLVKQYIQRQEINYLTANAETIAQQALPLIWPVQRNFELFELVQTSSFLGNVRVKILDRQKQVISDSGLPAEAGNYVVIAPFDKFSQELVENQTIRFMVLPERGQPAAIFFSNKMDIPPDLPDSSLTIIRRVDGVWGHRLIFEGAPKEMHRQLPADIRWGEIELEPADIQQTDLPSDGALSAGKALSAGESPAMDEVPSGSQDSAPSGEGALSRDGVMVSIGDKDAPVGYVELSGGSSFGAEAVATTRQAFLLAAGGVTLLAVLVGLFVSRGLTAPLRSLANAANQMSGGDLSIRAPVQSQGEIGQLARQFNQMAERLEASFSELAAERDTLRRFIADASHELRTPIAAVKNFNELLQGPAIQDAAARQEFLAESQLQIKRLEWITHNLLNLSRLEAGLVTLDITNQNVGEILSALQAAFKPLSREKSISLTVKYPESSLEFACDRARFELALSNLVDNALKFTPPGGQVELGAQRVGQTIRFWVKDTGPGIPLADRSRIFERFYRGQNTQNIAGSGLGLAIVQSTIQAHAGRILVEDTAGPGSCFIVELPC